MQPKFSKVLFAKYASPSLILPIYKQTNAGTLRLRERTCHVSTVYKILGQFIDAGIFYCV